MYGHVLDGGFLLEKSSIDRPGNKGNHGVVFCLYPCRIQQIIKQAVQRQHAGFTRINKIKRCLRAIGRKRKNAQPAGNHNISTRDDLPFIQGDSGAATLFADDTLGEQDFASATKLAKRLKALQLVQDVH